MEKQKKKRCRRRKKKEEEEKREITYGRMRENLKGVVKLN